MSDYDDLTKQHAAALAYEDECVDTLVEVVDAVCARMGWPEDHFAFVPHEDELSKRRGIRYFGRFFAAEAGNGNVYVRLRVSVPPEDRGIEVTVPIWIRKTDHGTWNLEAEEFDGTEPRFEARSVDALAEHLRAQLRERVAKAITRGYEARVKP